ncbi:uncharacterized protein LOC115217295 isoform X1 [Argonauta hians]
MFSSYPQSRNDGMKRPFDSRNRSYDLPPGNRYFNDEQRDSGFSSDYMDDRYSYPSEYPPMKIKLVRNTNESNSNPEMIQLKVAIGKLQDYLHYKDFSYNSAIQCLDQALEATQCNFFLEYNVRKGYAEKEGVLKLGSLVIGFGKSVSEEETQILAYIDALKSLKFKSIEEILSPNNSKEIYNEPQASNVVAPVQKTVSDLIIIESDMFASDRYKYSVSILHNSAIANKMSIVWNHAFEKGMFKVTVYIQDQQVGIGYAHEKAEAKKNAACNALFNYLYKTNIILQIASENESELWIPYSNVMYLVGEIKRRKNYCRQELAEDGPFATVIENLIDSYAWSELNREILFGPGMSNDEVALVKQICEKKNLRLRRKRHKEGHYFSLHTGEDYSHVVKYLQKNGGQGGKYRIVPKSNIPELKSATPQGNQKYSNTVKPNMNEKSGYRNYNDGSYRMGQGDLYNDNVYKNVDSNKREFDQHYVESDNWNNQRMKSNYDRNYVPDDYKREVNVCDRINSGINHNERSGYSQRASMNDDDRYNSMNDHSIGGFNQRSYDMDCNNQSRDGIISADDSRYFRNNFNSSGGDNEYYGRNNRGYDMGKSNDNYHSRTVYEYDNVRKPELSSSAMYNSRDACVMQNEPMDYNQDYCPPKPGPNYGREFNNPSDQYNESNMYAQRNENNYQMEERERMFANRNFHPMPGRQFDEPSNFQNRPMRQNQPDITFNNRDNFGGNGPNMPNRFGNMDSGNARYEREMNQREAPRNMDNMGPGRNDFPRPWQQMNSRMSRNEAMAAAQNLRDRISNNAMNRNQPPNQMMLLKLLTKKIAQNALQSNVKNILANAKRLSHIAKSCEVVERAKGTSLVSQRKATVSAVKRFKKAKPALKATPKPTLNAAKNTAKAKPSSTPTQKAKK